MGEIHPMLLPLASHSSLALRKASFLQCFLYFDLSIQNSQMRHLSPNFLSGRDLRQDLAFLWKSVRLETASRRIDHAHKGK